MRFFAKYCACVGAGFVVVRLVAPSLPGGGHGAVGTLFGLGIGLMAIMAWARWGWNDRP